MLWLRTNRPGGFALSLPRVPSLLPPRIYVWSESLRPTSSQTLINDELTASYWLFSCFRLTCRQLFFSHVSPHCFYTGSTHVDFKVFGCWVDSASGRVVAWQVVQCHMSYPYGVGQRDHKCSLDTMKRPAFPWKQHWVTLGRKTVGDVVSKNERANSLKWKALRVKWQ